MPNRRRIAGCVLLLVIGGCGSVPPEDATAADTPKQPANKEKKTIVWGPVTSGFQTRVWFEEDRPTFKAGEPVRIRFAVKNVSEKEQIILRRGFWPNHRVDVFIDGKDARSTKEGAKVRKLFAPGGTQEKTSPQVVKPGRVVETFEPIDLTTLFDLSAAGEYRVRILYQDGEPIPSNELTFKISAQ